jgi:endonuclease YncB( thermonuclease family)
MMADANRHRQVCCNLDETTMKRTLTTTAMLTLVALLATCATADTLTGKAVSIADGDTLSVLVDRKQIKIRLEGIDAPEKGQSMAWPC